MSIKEKLEADIKTAMLSGDKSLVTTLRGLKSAVLNVEVEKGKRETGLGDDEVIALFQKEAKKRQESADLYDQGGSPERRDKELAEKKVIEQYLPEAMSEADITAIIDEVIVTMGANGMSAMGQVIGMVKQKAGAAADGATIARIVKEKLQ